MNHPEEQKEREERFQYWLAGMDDALDRFHFRLSPLKASSLDFSLESLLELERFLLERLESLKVDPSEDEKALLDEASRYLGETIRRTIGGKWWLPLDDPDHVNYGVPVVGGAPNAVPAVCPLSIVTASLDRRTGNYIQSVVAHLKNQTDSGFSDLMEIKRKLGL